VHSGVTGHGAGNGAEDVQERLSSLDDQVKKLRCLYGISALTNNAALAVRDLMSRIVELIPAAYRYPEAACARIRCGEGVFESRDFAETPWQQTAPIFAQNESRGSVQVCYREEKPAEDEGPFLRAERELLNAVGGLLGAAMEKKCAQEALRLNEYWIRGVFGNLPVAVWVVDGDGVFTMAEGTVLRDLGRSPGEIVGRRLRDVLSDRPDIREFHDNALRGEEVVAEVEFMGRIYDSRFSPFTDANGAVKGVMCTAIDVTERVKVERELRETNDLLKKVFASTNYLIAHLDDGFNFIWVNEAYARADGHEPRYFPGKNYFALYPNQENQAIFQRVIRTGEPYRAREKAFIYAGNPERGVTYWDWDLFRMDEGLEARKGLVLILVDRTMHKKAVIELENSRAELRDLASHLQDLRENERKRIAREVHDELGALLTALKMDVSLLGPGVLKSTKKRTETFASALGLSDKAISMVQRITSDLRPRILDDFGLLPALEWLVEDFRKRTHIKAEITSGFREVMDKGQATVLFRIAQEALSNVARHSKATEVTLQLYTSPGWLLFSVTDNGIGIPQRRISDPSSFGLIGMRERAVALGGEVEIRNLPKRGAAVAVRIPLKERRESE
jgi:PAS domain S-box-containing protein